MKKQILPILLIVLSINLFAQERRDPPISFELLSGNERLAMSLSLNKPIHGNFFYTNISSAAAYYDYQKGRTELVSTNSIGYRLHKNFALSGGVQYHFVKGLVPNVALNLSYAKPNLLLVLTPYYNMMPWINVDVVGIAEYKPMLNNHLRLLTRVQGFYGYNFELNERERAMFYFRMGLSYKKYSVGLGGNIDYYTPVRPEIRNYGGFLRVDL
ncbi:MAG: hypothetical protein ACK5KP_02060 [Paludibacteraceae bacterium]